MNVLYVNTESRCWKEIEVCKITCVACVIQYLCRALFFILDLNKINSRFSPLFIALCKNAQFCWTFHKMQVMNSLTEGAVINVGDASVPFVTSQRAHFNVVLFFWDIFWCILLDRAVGIKGRRRKKKKKKNSVVVVELTLATGSVRQPIGERDAFNDIIKSSHPATAIT